MKAKSILFIALFSGGWVVANENGPGDREISALISARCIKCHSVEKAKGGVVLEGLEFSSLDRKNPQLLRKILNEIQSGTMPPPSENKLQPIEKENIERWAGALVTKNAKEPAEVPSVVIRRLNRFEYGNTVRDLFGVELKAEDALPFDPVQDGFDNNARALSITPVHFEEYEKNAREIAEKIVWMPEIGKPVPVPLPPAHQKLFVCQPTAGEEKACALKIIQRFTRLAFRRPVGNSDSDPLLKIFEEAQTNGDCFERGIQRVVQAVLLSPHFLFRVESDPAAVPSVHKVNEYELASRLSYLLWSSMPDEELLQLAEKNELTNRLNAQVDRMIHDPVKSNAFAVNFAGQWLELRPLRYNYRHLTKEVQDILFAETYVFFDYILQNNRSILEFIDSDYVFVNNFLSRLYGIRGVETKFLTKVPAPNDRRGGLLGQASVLTVTSNPARTSPVKRGKWVLDNLLDDPPEAAPANIPPLERPRDRNDRVRSMRLQMEDHRSNPSCMTCHNRMDPLGFGLENYDTVGRWRDDDGDFPVDSTGVLPSGAAFKSPGELKATLKTMGPQFARCLTKKLLIYALGRSLETSDEALLDRITQQVVLDNYKFQTLLKGIIQSEPFLNRKNETR